MMVMWSTLVYQSVVGLREPYAQEGKFAHEFEHLLEARLKGNRIGSITGENYQRIDIIMVI